VRLCEKHQCCYEVFLRDAAGLPLNRAGEWHFTWLREGKWSVNGRTKPWHCVFPCLSCG
jgi:hypothetical protein